MCVSERLRSHVSGDGDGVELLIVGVIGLSVEGLIFGLLN